MRDKGGEGSKNPKNLRDVIYGWSLGVGLVVAVGQVAVQQGRAGGAAVPHLHALGAAPGDDSDGNFYWLLSVKTGKTYLPHYR